MYSEHIILKQRNTHLLQCTWDVLQIDHILGYKSALNKYKKIEIIPCIFSDHNAMKLKINHKKNFGKVTNTWRLKNILLKNEWANQEVKGEVKKFMEANENDHHNPKPRGHGKGGHKRKVYSNPGLPKEEITLHLKEL